MLKRLFLGVLVAGGVMVVAMFVLFMVQSPQITLADLPEVEVEPTPSPTPRPVATPEVVLPPSGPRNFIPGAVRFQTFDLSTPIDLNVDRDRYVEFGATDEQETAIFRLRCEPPVPPRAPYTGYLEGCVGPGAGIMHLDEIVDAGIMSRQQVNDTIAGKTVQEWR